MKLNIIYTLILSGLFLVSCGSSKKHLAQGNYDKAITDATLALKKNPNNERNASTLYEAFNNATQRDIALIDQLETQVKSDPTKWKDLFDVYDKMLIREIQVLSVTPLYVDGKELQFDLPNVDKKAEEAKIKASDALYSQASSLMQKGDKQSAREAFALYDRLVEFNFDYADAREMRDLAKTKGSTNVFVKMANKTGSQLPATFEDDLLTFREGSFTDPWILYHTKKQANVNYEYEVDLDITQLVVGRNDQQQRQFREQQRVIVGYNETKNDKGETVRVPQYSTVYADVLETLQTKPIRVAGTVVYKDSAGKVLATIPVEREEAWQNNYAQFRGDQRALTQETIAKVQNGAQDYPTDQQLYDLSGKLLNQPVVALFEQNASNLN